MSVCGQGQQRPFRVARYLTPEQGLSQGQVNCLWKDSEGFLWLGTQDGLNRFDGYRFRQFFHESDDPASLSNNYIWQIYEDSRRDLWIGTFGGGLCLFDRVGETFQTFYPSAHSSNTVSQNAIRSFCEWPAGTLWTGTDKGLRSFDLNTRKFRAVPLILNELNNVISLFPFADKQILLGTANGLFCFNIQTEQLTPVTHSGKPVSGVSAFSRGENGQIWAGSLYGLFLVHQNPRTGFPEISRSFFSNTGHERGIPAIHSLSWMKNGILWIGTSEGLGRFHTRHPEAGYELFKHDNKDPQSLSNDLISCLLEVEPGLLWAGTREGVNCISAAPEPFFNLKSGGNAGDLCSSFVLGMVEDDAGNFWIATKGGLTRVSNFGQDPASWNTECLHPDNTPSMPADYVIRTTPAGKDALWVAFRRNGFALLKKDRKGKWFFEKIKTFDSLLGGAGMNGIYVDKQGVTWLATPGVGLIRWNPATGEHKVFSTGTDTMSLPHPYVFCLFEDSRNRFWVGTANGGLCCMDREKGVFHPFLHEPGAPASISGNMVLSIFEDSRKRLWICTANGLNLYMENGRFRRFTKKEGLPNEVIYGMLEDDEGRLWVSTNRGLACMSFRDSVLLSVRAFDVAAGLQGNEFNQHAFYRTRDGRFCFGGPNGLTIFRPSEISPYPFPPPVVLTDFQLFNQSVLVNRLSSGGSFFLEKSINSLEKIVLRHDQNFIAFEFAALGFTQPENNRYAYQMEGLDVQWVECGQRRYAGYPGLPPGEYTFRVKAANHDGVWNDTFKSLHIRVLPPWWRTWWAYILFAGAAGLMGYVFFRQRVQQIRQVEKAKTEEREQFRKRIARDFHDEAGNKITKLTLLGAVIRNRAGGDAGLQQLITQLENNIQDLRSGMRDFIWSLDPDNDNLYDTLSRLRDFANDLFEHSEICFSVEGLSENLRHISLDAGKCRHILLIFKEIANNCVRHSGADQAILNVSRREDTVSVLFSDNGTGFDKNAAGKGNGLQNIRTRAEKTGGEMTIRTAPGAGAGYQLDIKITQTGN
ncbi:MAG: hypothetical protein IPJ82_17310 [Lewinellaceae bacterium]|nr:hypothetical protein [Lewinellaceae bacterium]